ncbi:MAG: threonine/serine dehydratase [Candidatus Heimdallarchaeaceae archaeon]
MNATLVEEIKKAYRRIHNFVRCTPLERFYSNQNTDVFLKLENYQLTNSFKIRGLANKLLSISLKEKQEEVVTASTGNHGHAFAYATKVLDLTGTVFVPKTISRSKLRLLERYQDNIKIVFHGQDCIEAEEKAKEYAKEHGFYYISPYNDLEVIAGQGTIAIELINQLKHIDNVFIPIGGGGLISGIATYLKHINPDVKIIGCQPKNSAVMYESVKAGKILDIESLPTISDGTAGGIEKDSITFEICKELVDEYVLLSEEEIGNAMKLFLTEYFMCVEGAGALSLAAYQRISDTVKGNIVLIVSGAKIDFDRFIKQFNVLS